MKLNRFSVLNEQ